MTGKCKNCMKEVDYLVGTETGQRTHTLSYNDNGDYFDNNNFEFESLSELVFICPKCEVEICRDIDEAEKFLKSIKSEKEKTPEEKADEIIQDITDDSSLCIIREALEHYFRNGIDKQTTTEIVMLDDEDKKC